MTHTHSAGWDAGPERPRVQVRRQRQGASDAVGLAVIIDVFRAFTTAYYVAAKSPAAYWLVRTSEAIPPLLAGGRQPLLIGKPELGARLSYEVPNSPTLVAGRPITGRTVIHRSGAGATGVLNATRADEVVIGSFANVAAVVRYVRARRPRQVTLVSMGHEAGTPSLEDDLCAECVCALLEDRPFDLGPHWEALREGPGRYFFEGASEYPSEDFARCLERDRFDFVLRARLAGDCARLERVDLA